MSKTALYFYPGVTVINGAPNDFESLLAQKISKSNKHDTIVSLLKDGNINSYEICASYNLNAIKRDVNSRGTSELRRSVLIVKPTNKKQIYPLEMEAAKYTHKLFEDSYRAYTIFITDFTNTAMGHRYIDVSNIKGDNFTVVLSR